MKKLCILFEANYNDRKGLVNAVINRAKYLKRIADYDVDVVCLQGFPAGLNAIIRKRREHRDDCVVIDGVTIHILWYRRFFLDDVFSHRFHIRPILGGLSLKSFYKRMGNYGFISAHGASRLTYQLKIKYGIPYSSTWHGSDIHSQPFQSTYLRRLISTVLKHANMNFFVSKDLQLRAREIVGDVPSQVSYNGVDERFFYYDESVRKRLKMQLGVYGKKVVAFVGNLVPVKNALKLPGVFTKVVNKYKGPVSFWIIGDGYLRPQLESAFKEASLDCVFWGNQVVEKMPQFYNCMDVLVLPSVNEGLGMVLVEAIVCGSNAVGSKVGGIPEVIGEDNAFSLDNNFEDNISDRIVFMLTHSVKQKVSPDLNWTVSVQKENDIYKKYLR